MLFGAVASTSIAPGPRTLTANVIVPLRLILIREEILKWLLGRLGFGCRAETGALGR